MQWLKYNTFLLILLKLCAYTKANPDAKRLYDDLLSNYNRLIRPVSNNTETVLVKLGLRLSQLIDLVRNLMLMIIIIEIIYQCSYQRRAIFSRDEYF